MNNGCLSILSAFNQSLPSKPPWLRRSLQQDHPYIMHNHRPHFIMGFDASNQGKKSPQMFKWWPFHGQCMLKKCAYNLTPMIFKGVMVVAIWCKLQDMWKKVEDRATKYKVHIFYNKIQSHACGVEKCPESRASPLNLPLSSSAPDSSRAKNSSTETKL